MIYLCTRNIFMFFISKIIRACEYYRVKILACQEIKSRLIFLTPSCVRGREIVKSLSGLVSIFLTSLYDLLGC